MRIGIITFHFAHNYGAMLQAYALQETLCTMGHNAEIVDYQPAYHIRKFPPHIKWNSCWSFSPKTFLHNIIKKVLSYFYYDKRYANHIKFMNDHMRLTPCNPGFDGSNFDAIIVGSDQIWNKYLTGNDYDGMYYGRYFKCPVISYAASNQALTLSEEEQNTFKTLLKGIEHIGVREVKLRHLLQPLTNKKISVTLDPTLISPKSVYDDFNNPLDAPKKYVLVYEIGVHNKVVEMAKSYANKIGAELVLLTGTVSYNTLHGFDLTAGPEQFVGYIKNAECIFTTSFHGTALSIINERQFYTIRQNTAGDIRMESLLQQLELMDRIIPMEGTPEVSVIDYCKVNVKLQELQKKSISFIENALK